MDINIINDKNEVLELKTIEEEEYKDDFKGSIEEAELPISVSEPDEEYLNSEDDEEETDDIEENFEDVFENEFEEGDEE